MLALLLAWMFNRVVTDCHMAPEQVEYYELRATQVITVDEVCFDDQGLPFTCQASAFGPPLPFLQIPDPGVGTDVIIPQDYVANPELLPLCSPAPCVVGWPWFTPVVAVDFAGNRGTDACP